MSFYHAPTSTWNHSQVRKHAHKIRKFNKRKSPYWHNKNRIDPLISISSNLEKGNKIAKKNWGDLPPGLALRLAQNLFGPHTTESKTEGPRVMLEMLNPVHDQYPTDTPQNPLLHARHNYTRECIAYDIANAAAHLLVKHPSLPEDHLEGPSSMKELPELAATLWRYKDNPKLNTARAIEVCFDTASRAQISSTLIEWSKDVIHNPAYNRASVHAGAITIVHLAHQGNFDHADQLLLSIIQGMAHVPEFANPAVAQRNHVYEITSDDIKWLAHRQPKFAFVALYVLTQHYATLSQEDPNRTLIKDTIQKALNELNKKLSQTKKITTGHNLNQYMRVSW